MKVYCKKNLSGYSGTSDDAVYYYHPRLKQTFMREYVIPDNKANTDRTKSIMANLKLLQPSDGFKSNLREYLLAYNDHKDYGHKPMLTWTNVFMKLMHAMQQALPGQVNLKTITRQQITDQNLPCKTLRAAIEAGLLPAMKNYEYWTREI